MEKTQEKTAENQAAQPKKRLAKVVNLTGTAKETYESFRSSHPELASLTDSQTVETLIAAYGDSEAQKEEIDSLHAQIRELQNDYEACQTVRRNLEIDVDRLKASLDEANRTANANGEAASALQMKIDGMKPKENQVLCDVHPVAMHFLRQMAEKTGHSVGYILTDLFVQDLQNPRSNNLPYIVTTAEIRRVMEEMKTEKEAGRKEANNE